LRGCTPETLVQAFPGLSPSVARRVVHRLVGEDRDDLDGVPGLSKARAAELLERGRLDRLEVLDRRRSELDPFVKYLFRAADGRVFEAVRIPLEKPRWSVCLSSQVGCALACSFCETGRLGFLRNLEPWEMVEQALRVLRTFEAKNTRNNDRLDVEGSVLIASTVQTSLEELRPSGGSRD
jgi:23S rRNA (adenine2503-C2)-methyltransferase